jgi:beta-N-acetylhexosaminidase
MRTHLLLLLSFFLFACSAHTYRPDTAEEGSEAPPPPEPIVLEETIHTRASWVDETLESMTLEEKVAQMIFERAEGTYFSADDSRWQHFERLVRERKVGGFCFFAGDVYEYAMQSNRLQAISDVPLLIAADFEFGAAMRVRRATMFPRAMLLGATRNPQYAYDMGKVVAREARALGVHQVFAPVVDVNNNPMNPVINTRSFGEDPNMVAEMSAAFIRGMQEGGVLATAKHFPGHGDTDIDSHLDMPTLPFSRERLDTLELVGFRRAIDAGVMSMMIAHLAVPSLDSARGRPATLSSAITTGLLQGQMGYKGLIVTDAMDMRGVTKAHSTAEAAVLAVKAGTDVVLLPPSVDVAIDAIASAVRRGEIAVERVESSVRKILAVKHSLGLSESRFVNPAHVPAVVGSREHRRLSKQIARDGITVVKNDRVLPLEKNAAKRVVGIAVGDAEDAATGSYFRSLVRERLPRFEDLRIDQRSNKIEYDSVLTRAANADILLVHMYVRTRSAQMTGFLSPRQTQFLLDLRRLNKPTVVVSLGNPYLISVLPTVEAYLAGYSDAEVVVEAAVEAIFGEVGTNGKLPISIPGTGRAPTTPGQAPTASGQADGFRYGTGIELQQVSLRFDEPEMAGFDAERLKRVDEVVTQAIKDSAFPGAVVLAAKDGVVGYHKAFGTYEYHPYSRRIDTGTLFDVASVTKVIATTSAVMRLADEGKLRLDDRVSAYIPQFSQNGKENVTVYNLMVHNSGLPAWRKYYEICSTPECVLDSVFASPLAYATGDSTVYSDLGMITMGKMVEMVAGVTLDKYVDSVFFRPLGMSNTMFNPPASLRGRIAPTEVDSHWQKTNTAVRGRVHDENAATLGGVAGHAGLFSTASDLSVLLQMILNGGTYGGKRYVREETIRQFTKRQSAKSSRAIGWDTRSPARSWAGTLMSNSTYLHTGFTGTSVAVDPERKLIVILLTNRVHPTRNNTKILELRPKLHDAVVEAVR